MSWKHHPLVTRLKAKYIRWKSGTRINCTGTGHTIEIEDALLYGVRIEISGTGNTLKIGPNARMWGTTIQLRGENLQCIVENHCKLRHAVLVVEDRDSRLVIRQMSSGTGARLLCCEGGLVEIGQDCMMSAGSDIRNTDGHSILDQATGVRVNPAADVIVGDHAWIGLGVQILKGVRVGEHSIAAAGCVVVRDVPAHTIVAGIPAKPVRTGITWVRERLKVQRAAELATVSAAS